MPTRKAQWESAAQFDFGSPTKTNVAVVGVGDDAYVRLAAIDEGSENVPFTTPANYTYDSDKVLVADGKAKLKPQAGSEGSGDFPFTTPGNHNYNPTEIVVSGGKAKLVNDQKSGSHSWPYSDIGNYTVSPVASVDIISGKAQLHDQGSHVNDDDVDYNTPGDYVYDPAKIESVDKGGGNRAFRLKGGGITPYGWWHLNESSGAVANDSSGNGRNGTLINMEDGDWVPGKLNNALIFDGTNECVGLGDVANFDNDEPFSLEFWMKTTFTGARQSLISRMLPTGYSGWRVAIFGGWFEVWIIGLYPTNYIFLKKAIPTYYDGNWHHVVITYDGSETAAGTKVYFDGALQVMTVSKDTLPGESIQCASDCTLGGINNLGGFPGLLDEVVVYDIEVSQTDVDYRYNLGNGTEEMPGGGGYATDNPTVVQGFDAAFGTVLEWKDYVETKITSVGCEIKYNISNDSGVTWYYWNGAIWTAANGTYAQANTGTEIDANFLIFSVGNQHLRVKAFLHSDAGIIGPELDNASISWYDVLADYVTDGRITGDIEIDESPDPLWSWDSFAETVEEPVNTEVRYALSNDGGGAWLYWSGAAWVPSDGVTWAQFSTGADVTAHIGSFPKTNPKLKLRAYLKTTDSTKTPKLNNIQVDYKYGYSYTLADPKIKAVFSIGPGAEPLVSWDTLIETVTKPVNTEVKYTLSDDDGVTWQWWSGAAWVASNNTYAQANIAAEITANISAFSIASKVLRISAFLHTSDSEKTPEIDNVQVDWTETPVTYPVGDWPIEMDSDLQPAAVGEWTGVTETVTEPTDTGVLYQYSINGGSTWNGTWLDADGLQVAIQGVACVGDGTDTLRIKCQLSTTDSGETPEIDNLQLAHASEFELQGTYISHAYQPEPSTNGYFVGAITFDVEMPAGTTLTVEAKAVDHTLEEGYAEYSTGESISICGDRIQWKATLETTNNHRTPRVSLVEVEFHVMIGIMRTIEAAVEAVSVLVTAETDEIDVAIAALTSMGLDLLASVNPANIRTRIYPAAVDIPARNVAATRMDRIEYKVKAELASDWSAPIAQGTVYCWYVQPGDINPTLKGEGS